MVKFLERWRVRKSRIWNLTNCRLCQNRGLYSYCGLSLSLNLIIKIVIFILFSMGVSHCIVSLFFLFCLCSEVDIFSMSFSFLYLTEEKFSIMIFLFCHGNIKLRGNFNSWYSQTISPCEFKVLKEVIALSFALLSFLLPG